MVQRRAIAARRQPRRRRGGWGGSTRSAAIESRIAIRIRMRCYDVAADTVDDHCAIVAFARRGAAVALEGKIHLIGGASPTSERASVGWHEVYDPQADKWEIRKALPAARDHVGAVAHNGMIHIIGGRFNTFEYNTDLHHVYLPVSDTWKERAAAHGTLRPRPRDLPRPLLRDGRRIRRAGQRPDIARRRVRSDESYDPATNTWQSHAPMTTPRHAVGATTIGDAIYVAGEAR